MWQTILDKYEISDKGEIRNIHTGRKIKQFIGKDGYLRTQIAGKTRLVHRMVAVAFIPFVVGKNFVNHKDGNKQNNDVSNLEWCTRTENMKHAYAQALKKPPTGARNGRCRLTEFEVEFILENYMPRDALYGAKPLAKKFGVAPQTICAVVSGQNWKHKKSGGAE